MRSERRFKLVRPALLALLLTCLPGIVVLADSAEPPPRLAFSSYFGGEGSDWFSDLALDDRGRVYLAGTTDSENLPGRAPQPPRNGYDKNGFVTRIDPAQASIDFTWVIGGSGLERVTGVAVNSDGFVFVTGDTNSADFPFDDPAPPKDPNRNDNDGFLVKLDPEGRIVFARRFASPDQDSLRAVRIGADGALWITGYLGPGAQGLPIRGPATDAVSIVGRVDPATGDAHWLRRLGGSRVDFIHDIDIDAHGNAYLTGRTSSPDLPTTAGSAQPVYGGSYTANLGDAWVAKLTPSGALSYLTYIGGPGDEYALGIGVDRAGRAHITGFSYGGFPVVNAVQPEHAGGDTTFFPFPADAFLTKLSADGSSIIYSTYLGGSGNDRAMDVAVNPFGEAVVTGYTHSADFPLVRPIQDGGAGARGEAFITRVSPAGTLLSSSLLGGNQADSGGRLLMEPTGRTWLTGGTHSGDFPTVGAFQTSQGGFREIFLCAIDEPLRDLPGLDLGGERFRLDVVWYDPYNDRAGVGTPAPLTTDTGTFWFFREGNSELVVKVLDGRQVNGHFWVFYGGLSTVEYWLRVTDVETGARRIYHNPAFHQASLADTTALPGAGGPLPLPPSGQGGEALAAELGGGRFEVRVDWTDPRTGEKGTGRMQALSEDTATAWFFRQDNVELLVKVLDGRPLNGHFWVFYASLTDLQYTLRVLDRVSGDERSYDKPPLVFQSGSDIDAF